MTQMRAYQVIFKQTVEYPNALTLAATDLEDAKKRALAAFETGGPAATVPAVEILSITDISESDQFKQLIAAQYSDALKQEEMFKRWLDESTLDDEVISATPGTNLN